MIPAEKWRRVRGTPYEASDLGRIRRAEGGQGCRAGHVIRSYVVQTKTTAYRKLHISVGGCVTTHWEHRLVATAWHGPAPFEDAQVDHLNGDTMDNTPPNLEWTDRSTNINRAIARKAGRV